MGATPTGLSRVNYPDFETVKYTPTVRMVRGQMKNEVTLDRAGSQTKELRDSTTMSLYSQRQNGSTDNDSNDSDDGDYEPDKRLKVTPDSGFVGEGRTVFGNSNQWGESLGVAFENVEVEDGVLYKHTEKDEYKLFSWEEIIGAHPAQYDEPKTADEPDQFFTKDYGVAKVQYEFVGARIAEVPEFDDEGNPTGEVLCEEDTAGDYELGNTIMWFDGNGPEPNGAAKSLAKKLTSLGNDAVVSKNDAVEEYGDNNSYYNDDGDFLWINCWLANTSNENIMREDLKGRQLRFYKEVRDSDQSDNSFHYPVVEDVKTDKLVRVKNSNEQSGSGDSEQTSGTVQDSSDSSGTPEPIQDYLDTVGGMEADEVLAQSLLTDMVEEPDNNLTEEMVEEYGGEEEIIGAVVA